ncbi:hypothetical protein Trydic_g15653 [Trypoxylus dichotomus]
MEQRYWACCMDQKTNTGPKTVGKQKAWSASMLENEGDWKAVETTVRKAIGMKESHERSRHRANMLSSKHLSS